MALRVYRSPSCDSPISVELHDRCVISEEGTVRIIGSSVTGVGKNLTSVITATEEVTRTYHDKYERIWDSATPVPPQSPRTSSNETPSNGADS